MTIAQPVLVPGAVAGLEPIPLADANSLLAAWGHYLGAVHRPFGSDAWALQIDSRPVSVAVSASAVSATVAGYQRGEVVELARLCSAPESRAFTRPMLRLWREVAAQRWPYWPVRAAVAYSQTRRHEGDLYRWDGWRLVTESAGSTGGGPGRDVAMPRTSCTDGSACGCGSSDRD